MTFPRMLVAGVVAAGTFGIPATAAQRPSPHARAARAARAAEDPSALPLRIRLQYVSPVVTRSAPLDRLTVYVQLHNSGDTPVGKLRIRVRIGSPMRSRSGLERIATSPEGSGENSDDIELDQAAVLAPGGTTNLRKIEFPLDRLPSMGSDASIRPLRVLAVGRRGGRSSRVVGATDTFLVWQPDHVAPTQVALLLPVTTAAPRGAGPDVDPGVVRDLGENGRLTRLVAEARTASSTAPVTLAVDPEVVDQALRVARAAPKGPAERWLIRLSYLFKNGDSLQLPYADSDVAALAHAGLPGELGHAYSVGRRVLARIGDRRPADLAWPPNGEADVGTLGALADLGVRGVVLRGSALPPDNPPDFTPSATYPLSLGGSRTITAFVADDALSDLVDSQSTSPNTVIAVQRVLAELAMITLEQPSNPRAVVIAPPRVWSPRQAFLRTLLLRLGQAPYLTPRPLSALLSVKPSSVPRASTPAYDLDARSDELPAPFLDGVGAQRARLDQFRSILTRPDDAVDVLDTALLRAQSVRFRDDVGRGEALVAASAAGLDAQWRKLAISSNGATITLTSRSGNIPITLENRLGQPVRVLLRAQSLRLAEPSEVALTGGDDHALLETGRTTVALHARALTAGVFPVSLNLLGPDRSELPVTAQVRLRSTAYGAVALVVTGSAAAVLFVAAGARLVRRRRRHAVA